MFLARCAIHARSTYEANLDNNINSIREWPDGPYIIITFTMMMMMMMMIVSLSFFTVFTANGEGSVSRLWKGNRRRTAQIFRRIQNF